MDYHPDYLDDDDDGSWWVAPDPEPEPDAEEEDQGDEEQPKENFNLLKKYRSVMEQFHKWRGHPPDFKSLIQQ